MGEIMSTIDQYRAVNGDSEMKQVLVGSYQKVAVVPDQQEKTNLAPSLNESSLKPFHLPLETSTTEQLQYKDFSLLDRRSQMTPTRSPKVDISTKWREIHGSSDWDKLLDPLDPWLRREIVKYGEFSQATYDAFDFDSFSKYCGSCRYSPNRLFDKLDLHKNGYMVSKYIYAMSQFDIPRWIEKSELGETWSKDSNWMGFVAVSNDEESRRIGRRDIVVAWRGTIAPSEWFENLQTSLELIDDGEVKVEHGFLSIYTSKSESTRYNKTSASEQVMLELARLVSFYKQKGEEVSLTITGHSLGGALALLNAYEAAYTFPLLPICVISFAAPRVGNIAFRDKLHEMGVKVLRVVVKQDMVPKLPGLVFNECLPMFDEIMGKWNWIYTHVGVELKLDLNSSPFLKRDFDLLGFHCLEMYLHLVDGFLSTTSTFRSEARRDVALVNKDSAMLGDELRIPENWYQLANKGLVCNSYGRWVEPSRDPEDIPSPSREALTHCLVTGVVMENLPMVAVPKLRGLRLKTKQTETVLCLSWLGILRHRFLKFRLQSNHLTSMKVVSR